MTDPLPQACAEIQQRCEAEALVAFIERYRQTEQADIDFLLAAIKNPNTDPRKTVAAFRKQMLQVGHNEGYAALTALTERTAELQMAVERVEKAIQRAYFKGDGYDIPWRKMAHAALAAGGHAPAVGWVSVPVEPTEAMCKQADSNWSGFCSDTPGAARKAAARLYRAMIAASGHGKGGER